MHIANEQLCILFDELTRESLTRRVRKLQGMHLMENKSNAKKDYEEMLRNPYDENDAIKVNISAGSVDETGDYLDKSSNSKPNIGLKFVSDNANNESFFSLIKKQRYWMAYMDMNPKLRIFLQFIVILINFSIIAL